jgi:NAD(P)-dependent dehydrogenase (short-subunit alcohol dehydrogenase family)
MKKVWLITGAGSGIGARAAKAALRAGDCVVATGRTLDKVRAAYRDVASRADHTRHRAPVRDETSGACCSSCVA